MDINDKTISIAREAADRNVAAVSRCKRPVGLLGKASELMPRVGEEHEQIASLLRRFSREEACAVVSDKGVDLLLDIQLPLETVLSGNGERLYRLPDARELERIREWRASDPKAALATLFEILQRIRDKREHAGVRAGAQRVFHLAVQCDD
jgi:hypothetical protein